MNKKISKLSMKEVLKGRRNKEAKKGKEVSIILKTIIKLFAIFSIVFNYLANKLVYNNSAEAFGATIWSILGIAIGFMCAGACKDMANEINKNVNWAYATGFFFSLFGLLVYWIYSKVVKK